MSEKHTPGPWEVVDDPQSTWIMARDLNVAQVYSGLNCPPEEEAKPNSRLIAAAVNSYDKHCGERAVECAEADLLGELLEACKRRSGAMDCDMLNGGRCFNDDLRKEVREAARAAIAKAEGKP